MFRKFLGVLLVIATLAVFALPAAADGGSRARVYVVHGIPGADLGLDPALPVDVSVNGACLLKGFTFKQIVGPLRLAPGTYQITISLSDGNCGQTPVLSAPVPFSAGENASVVAHLTADGGITASKFTNDTSRLGAANTRVLVHHTAAAPAVDVELARHGWFPREFELAGVTNGQQGAVKVRFGTWFASINPAGSETPVFGPARLFLLPNRVYLVYAVGSLTNNTFTLLVKSIPNGF